MKLITKLSIMTSFGLLLIIFLSACGSKGEAPVVVSNSEITIGVGVEEPDWTSFVIIEDDVDEDFTLDSSMIDVSDVDLNVLGVYTAVYTITDSDKNTTEFELTVNVVDKTKPYVDLLGDSYVYLTIGEEYVEPGIFIFDNYDYDLTYDVIGRVDTNTIGEYILNYTSTDSSGNTSAILTRAVVVENYKQTISNKDEIYFSKDNFTITKEDLFNKMIDPSGLYLFLDYIDSMILSDYIDAVTNEELAEELMRLTFYTTDTEKINKIDPETRQSFIDVFNKNLLEMGYNPENTEEVNEYLSLIIAKRNSFIDQYTNKELSSDFYNDNKTLEDYYDATVKGDVCALELRFNSENEAINVFNHFNLVFNYNEGFGKYIGDIPIEDVDTFNSINTIQLTNEETFTYFVKMYNYMNPSDIQLPIDITKEELCLNYPELTNYVYSDIIDNHGGNSSYMSFINYIFDDLNVLYDMYSYEPYVYGDNQLFAYKISEEDILDFNELSSEDLSDFDLEYTKLKLLQSDSFLEEYMYSLRAEFDFNLVEQFLGTLYEFNSYSFMNKYKDPSLMATLGEEEITTDMFYDYAERRLGTKYTVDLLGRYNLLNNGVYLELYGDDYNVLTNQSDKMIEYREQIQQIKDFFLSDGYAAYGFSPYTYTWNEFMFLALNSKTDTEALMNLLVYQTLTDPYTMSDFEFDLVADYIQNQYDNFFDLNVEHLLLYLDYDNDFIPDDYLEYIESLNETDLLKFNDLTTSFDSLVRSKYNSGLTFQEISSEFNDSLMNDELNEWAIYKQYGFKVLNENLTESGQSLNVYNTSNFDNTFKEALKRIYDDYSLEVENSQEDIPLYLDPSSLDTQFGRHIILASKGNNFEQPSAYFDQSSSSETYTEGSNNLNDLPSKDQISLYKTIEINKELGEYNNISLPDSVYDAIEYYYSPVFSNSVFNNSFLIEAVEGVINGNSTFTNNNIENMYKALKYYEALLDSINSYE